MRGQRTARRLAPLERWHCDLLGCRQVRRGLGLRRILFQVGKLQLKLIEQRATLRGLSELFIVSLSFSIVNVRAWASASAAKRAARSDRNMAFRVITSSGRESSALIERRESQYAGAVWTDDRAIDSNRCDQPAACGRHVYCGIRQSMPSSR
jgi:hypothetical protein